MVGKKDTETKKEIKEKVKEKKYSKKRKKKKMKIKQYHHWDIIEVNIFREKIEYSLG